MITVFEFDSVPDKINMLSIFSGNNNLESDKYILQVAGINEYLQNDSYLQDYVYVHECYKFDKDAEFIVLLRDEALKTLARTAEDDRFDANIKVHYQQKISMDEGLYEVKFVFSNEFSYNVKVLPRSCQPDMF